VDRARRRLRIRGQVQGVGFRPFVYRIATDLGLAGFVGNDGEGVFLEVEGAASALDGFARRLGAEAPRLARIVAVEAQDVAALGGEEPFAIVASETGGRGAHVTPDTAVCPDCLAELFDPADRRWRYPFINCTNCGPRYTITRALPYDRPNTSMAAFAQCPACLAEYREPRHRRFHAQPNACPACGPSLALTAPDGVPLLAEDPLAATLALIQSGHIVAIKGLGGFHLVCDAARPDAVRRLRERKAREEKPFALMVANAASVLRHARLEPAEREAMESPERPIVLLSKLDSAADAPEGVAPGLALLGAMLPYTPLHYLLFHEAAGRPPGMAWLDEPQELTLVCTSANPGGEPLVIANDEAFRRLGGIADALLLHDREILVRCDDTVAHVRDGRLRFIRRARGQTPRAIPLARAGPPVLALGGYLKNTVCVTRGDEAFVSQHVGDLDNRPTCRALEETALHLLNVLDVEPAIIACDLHPDFESTRLAAAMSDARGLPLVQVQHHHAHVAAVMAEHRLARPVLGLALDGVGLGEDGEAWGGELLRVDAAGCTRVGHLRPIALPGGDRAAREPWRMAAAALHALGRSEEIERRFSHAAAGAVRAMLERDLRCPRTSSMGRWFDAASGLLGLKEVMHFEGQAAMLLEGLATAHGPVEPMPQGWRLDGGVLDLLPLVGRLANARDASPGAALFHCTLAAALADWVVTEAARAGLREVVLSGGCFMNRLLAADLESRLVAAGLAVYEACELPPNDGGISVGQAWVALLAPGGETQTGSVLAEPGAERIPAQRTSNHRAKAFSSTDGVAAGRGRLAAPRP
jgi:hydrogenase maturation protein HypF